MKENQVGLSVNVEGVGYVDARFATKTVSEVKAIAGKAFHLPHIQSVCVYNHKGEAPLYLRKDENGRCIKREEIKLMSGNALK